MTFSRAVSAKWLLCTATTLITLMLTVLGHVACGWLSKPPYLVWAVGAVAWAVLCGWYIPAFCRRFHGSFDGSAVRTQSGVWVRRQTLVPLSALRTFEVWAPPLHRFFGCRTVILRFAGGSAWLTLLGEKTARCLAAALEEHAV